MVTKAWSPSSGCLDSAKSSLGGSSRGEEGDRGGTAMKKLLAGIFLAVFPPFSSPLGQSRGEETRRRQRQEQRKERKATAKALLSVAREGGKWRNATWPAPTAS